MHSSTVHRRRPVVVILAMAIIGVALTACNPNGTSESTNLSAVNALRAGVGVPELVRTEELDIKARAQAERMANRATIYHSKNLASGVSAGWAYIGENVAMAGSVEQAEAALEASPPHYENLTNPAFNQVGIGVAERNGVVYVVQVFVSR